MLKNLYSIVLDSLLFYLLIFKLIQIFTDCNTVFFVAINYVKVSFEHVSDYILKTELRLIDFNLFIHTDL